MDDLEFFSGAFGRFFQFYPQIVAQVVAARQAAPPSAALAAEKDVKEVAEFAETFKTAALAEIETFKAAARGALAGAARLAVVVVLRALGGVGEDLIGFVDLFELIGGPAFFIDVGVVLAGQIAVRALNLVWRRALRYAEGLVVVPLHTSIVLPSSSLGVSPGAVWPSGGVGAASL